MFQFDVDINEHYKKKLQKKYDKNVYGYERHFLKEMNRGFPTYQCTMHGYKRRKLTDLTLEEKLEVVDDVVVKKDYHENICSRYGIGRESIKTLLRNMKKDPLYLKKLHSKDKTKLDERAIVLESVESLLKQNG